MRLIYVDESGISTNEQFTVVAGVVIDADKQWLDVAERIDVLIAKYVPEQYRQNFTFHAKDMFHGTGRTLFDRRTYPPERSHEALKELLKIPGEFCLPIVFGFVNKHKQDASEKFKASKPRDKIATSTAMAFSMCAVAAERFMKQHTVGELATMHVEQNADTQRMIRLARKSLGGKMRLNIAKMFSSDAQKYLPITKIIDEVSFHGKDDAFLLQIADACALMIRYAIEGRKNCNDFFNALFVRTKAADDIHEKFSHEGGGYNIITFARREH